MGSMIAAGIVAFGLAAVFGLRAIDALRNLGAKQTISTDAPTRHSAKQGTPTMGGLLILAAFTVSCLLFAPTSSVLPIVLLTLAFGFIGFLDDYLSAKRGKNLGFRAREKFAAQCLVAGLFALWLAVHAHTGDGTTGITLPAFGNGLPHVVDFGMGYYALAILFLVGLSNATNITDGLDGLSSGVVIPICLALAALTAASTAPTLSIVMVSLAGALAGFLWWNAYPAKVFMGDTGSLALGAALAGTAIVAKCEVALIIASLVVWAELFSVIIQVTVFKIRRKQKGLDYAKTHRIFRRAPLHHHFEECGWPETQVVTQFWIISALCAGIAYLWGKGF